jgi:hypothetical protein
MVTPQQSVWDWSVRTISCSSTRNQVRKTRIGLGPGLDRQGFIVDLESKESP